MPMDLSTLSDEDLDRLIAERAARQPQQASGALGDAIRSAGAGLRSGVEAMAGLPGDLNDWGGEAVSRIAERFGASPETAASIAETARRISPMRGLPTTDQVREATDGVTGGDRYQPQTVTGEYARTIGEFAPAALQGPGGAVRRVAQALLPAVGAETFGQATKDTDLEPVARVAGALVGATSPAVARRMVQPNPISPERQELVRTLKREGVDLTAGQVTGNKRLQNIEAERGGRRIAEITERQGEQFTRAALARTGTTASRATPDVLDEAFTRIGAQFDNLADRTQIQIDQKLVEDMAGVLDDYRAKLGPSQQAPVVEELFEDVLGYSQHTAGAVPGDFYKRMRTRMDRMARDSSDSELVGALRGFREALDDGVERSMGKAGADAWRQTRREYRNLLVIERAATGAGENAAQGLIGPSQLRNATVAKHGRREYARGRGDFADLARAGEGLMRPLPNSGTAGRLEAMGITGVPAVAGAVVGSMMGHAEAGMGAALGVLAPHLIGRAVASKPGQSYFRNQVLGGQGAIPDARTRALIAAILGTSRARE
jgi:hypothetical protein